jgi:large subunit ribosomal protein L17
MKHNVAGTKLGRDTNARKALVRGLIAALIQRGRIETTEAKAKAIKGEIDKLVTLALKKTNATMNKLNEFFGQKEIVDMLLKLTEGFGKRTSGFTRMYKTAIRKGDNAQLMVIEWSDKKAEELKPVKIKK